MGGCQAAISPPTDAMAPVSAAALDQSQAVASARPGAGPRREEVAADYRRMI